jgi:hypothetical protein
MKTTEIVDVVSVNNVILTVGYERVGGVNAEGWGRCWQIRDKGG